MLPSPLRHESMSPDTQSARRTCGAGRGEEAGRVQGGLRATWCVGSCGNIRGAGSGAPRRPPRPSPPRPCCCSPSVCAAPPSPPAGARTRGVVRRGFQTLECRGTIVEEPGPGALCRACLLCITAEQTRRMPQQTAARRSSLLLFQRGEARRMRRAPARRARRRCRARRTLCPRGRPDSGGALREELRPTHRVFGLLPRAPERVLQLFKHARRLCEEHINNCGKGGGGDALNNSNHSRVRAGDKDSPSQPSALRRR